MLSVSPVALLQALSQTGAVPSGALTSAQDASGFAEQLQQLMSVGSGEQTPAADQGGYFPASQSSYGQAIPSLLAVKLAQGGMGL